MSGYSRRPLSEKLGLAPGSRVQAIRLPRPVRARLWRALERTRPVRGGREPIDLGFVFARSADDLGTGLSRMARQLAPTGALWVAWPKKSSSMAGGLDEREVRERGLRTGLVDVKVCAIDDTWSGLKFVRRLADRVSTGSAPDVRAGSGRHEAASKASRRKLVASRSTAR